MLAPLPPLDTKVVDVLAQLKDAANHGDARAACRVGIELARCYQLAMSLASDQRLAEEASRTTDPARARQLQEIIEGGRAFLAPDVALCDGVDTQDRAEAWSYLLQSASAGNAAAAAAFYTGPPTQRFAESSEVLDIWAEQREAFRDMAIRSGDLYALHQAASEARSGLGWGGPSRPFPRDLERSVEYGTALLPLLADDNAEGARLMLERTARFMTPEAFSAAQARGEALRARYFADAHPIEKVNRVGTPRPQRCADP